MAELSIKKLFYGFKNSFKKTKINANTFFSALFKLFFTVLLPIFIINRISIYFCNDNLNKAKLTQQQELINFLSKISGNIEPANYFNNEFKALADIPHRSETFKKRQQEILKLFPKDISICVYDKNGSLISSLSNLKSKNIAQNYLKAVQNPELVTKGKIRSNFLKQFSGYALSHENLNLSPNTIIELGDSNENKYGGYFHLHGTSYKSNITEGYMIVFITRHITSEILLPIIIDKTKRQNTKNVLIAWQEPNLDIDKSEKFQPDSNGFTQEAIKKINNMPFGENIVYITNKNGKECCSGKISTKTGIRIIGAYTEPTHPSYIFQIISLLIKLAAIILTIILFPIYLGITDYAFGFRTKISIQIIFSSIISISTLIFAGIAYSNEIENNLKNEFKKIHTEELTHIDEDILKNYGILEKKFIKISNFINPNVSQDEMVLSLKSTLTGSNSKNTHKNLLKEKYPFIEKFTFSTTTNKLIYQNNEGYKITKSDEIDQKFKIIDFINGNFDDDIKYSPNSIISGIGGLDSIEVFTTKGFGNAGANDNWQIYIESIFNKNYDIVAFINIFIRSYLLQEKYLLNVSRKRDKLLMNNPLASRFAAIPISKSILWRPFPKLKTNKEIELLRLSNKAYNLMTPVHEIVTINNKQYFVSAMPGNNLNGYCLFLAKPYKVITNAIKLEKKKVVYYATIIIVIAIITAFYISTILLKSMGNLQNGLRMISEGDFRNRLPNSPITEFSSMSQSLNTTMYQLGELKIAKTVQETLLPDKELSGNDWELCGKCITATELGGDHIDWLQLSDGRILIIIGDVTGHGIAPALVQASMKVWLALHAETSSDAVSLAKEINKLHINHGVSQFKMTAWFGYYTPSTGELEFTSAGHPYPILLKEDGKIEIIKVSGMPIGSTLNIRLKGEKIILNPGSSLILYTDGLAEIKNKSGVMLGFDGLSSICASTFGMNATEAINTIFKKAQQCEPQNDDQTVVILRRKTNNVS